MKLGKPKSVLDSTRQTVAHWLVPGYAELEGRERIYRTIVEETDDSIAVKDSQLRYVIANRAFLRRRDLPLERVRGKTAEDIYPADIAAERTKEDSAAIATGTVSLSSLRAAEPTAMDDSE